MSKEYLTLHSHHMAQAKKKAVWHRAQSLMRVRLVRKGVSDVAVRKTWRNSGSCYLLILRSKNWWYLAAIQGNGEGSLKEIHCTLIGLLYSPQGMFLSPSPPSFFSPLILNWHLFVLVLDHLFDSEMAVYPCMGYFHWCATATWWPCWWCHTSVYVFSCI